MRERLRQPTLNAVKAFEATARLGSLKAAAEALGVTSSAVSHQVRQLEEEIGKQLFIRRNNAIELTGEGYLLFEQVAPALRTIARATEAIRTDTKAVALNVTNAFALLWLIPRLPDFQKRQPRIAIEMATVRRPVVLDDSVELAISYSRHAPPVAGAVELLKDLGLPMAASGLSPMKSGRARDIRDVPLISSTPDDWDWRGWAAGQQHRVRAATHCLSVRQRKCGPLPRAEPGSAWRSFLPRSALPRSRAACWFPSAPSGSATSAATGLPRRPGCAALPRSSGPGCSRWRPAFNPDHGWMPRPTRR